MKTTRGFARRTLATFALAAALISVMLPATAASAAGKPTRSFLPATGFTSDPGQLCSFSVQFDVLEQNEYAILFTDANGDPVRAIFSGRLVVQMTNVTNGHTLTVNASGPGTVTFEPDGSQIARLEGPGLVFLFPGDTGGPALFMNFGVAVERLSGPPDFRGDLLSQTGRRVDLCPLLA
jgi:hypothetical protein